MDLVEDDSIDWSTCDFEAVENNLRDELDKIQDSNIKTIIELKNLGGQLLPFLQKSILELSNIETSFKDYCEQLAIRGLEIQQIETINTGLEQQSHNQLKLLKELGILLEKLDIDEDLIIRPLVEEQVDSLCKNSDKMTKIEIAAQALQSKVNEKFENEINRMKSVQDRQRFFRSVHQGFIQKLKTYFLRVFQMAKEKSTLRQQRRISNGFKLGWSMEECQKIILDGRRLLLLIKNMDPSTHFDLIQSFRIEMKTCVDVELGELIEFLKNSIRKEERPYLFTKSGVFSSFGTGTGASGSSSILTPIKSPWSSNKLFVDMAPLEISAHLTIEQAMEYLLLSTSGYYYALQSLTFLSFYGLKLIRVEEGEERGREKEQKKKENKKNKEECNENDSISKDFSRIINIINTIFDNLDLYPKMLLDLTIRSDLFASIEILAVITKRNLELNQIISLEKESSSPSSSLLSCSSIEEIDLKISSAKRFSSTLKILHDRCVEIANNLLSSQLEAIREAKITAKKRTGIFFFVSTFPIFIFKMDQILAGVESKFSVSGGEMASSPSIKVDDSLYKFTQFINGFCKSIGMEIFKMLELLVLEASKSQDVKESLNASVMTIQNTNYLLSELGHFLEEEKKEGKEEGKRGQSMMELISLCRTEHVKHMQSYAEMSLMRLLGPVYQFFDRLQRAKGSMTSIQDVRLKSEFEKNGARRLLLEFTLKDWKRELETLITRVIKHFPTGTPPEKQLCDTVWRNIIKKIEEITDRYEKLLKEVYEDQVRLSWRYSDIVNLISNLSY